MGRLFWKFFFSYWVAMLIAVIGVGMTAWLVQLTEQDRDLSLDAGPRAAFILGTAAATIRHGGPPALLNLMDEWRRRGDVEVFAVDGAGRDLLGRPVPPDALERARQLTEKGAGSDRARQVHLANGDTWLLFIPLEAAPFLNRLLFRAGPPSPLVPLVTGALASLIFGALLSWYVARPIRVLRGAFEALSRGRLDTRVAPMMGPRGDEVADLGRDFDGMAQRLQRLMTSQQSLLHDVSHELRSPLARLQAAIGLARQNPQRIEGSLDRIEQEAQRVDALVEQLLTLSRLEANVSTGSRERVERTDLVDLVASIAEDAHFEAQASGREVTFSSRGEAIADVRAELIHRAVENVVRNAVKYTLPNTTVEVDTEIQAEPGRTLFMVRVADRGPGVPDDELEAIFERFYRGADGLAGRGFGLGLAISRRAVEAHAGQVVARNREGGGLVIEIRLPLGDVRLGQN
jgi:two-component system, OmpR family, sensor kinase